MPQRPIDFLQNIFDPESSGYDMQTALAAGLERNEAGHMGSLDPRTGMVLKGRQHESWNPMVQTEMSLGNTVEYNPNEGRYFSVQGGMYETATPDATSVHNNIDDLIYQSDAENLWQKALNKVEQGMSGYNHPQPITGTAPDIALNPLLAAKKISSLMKLLKKVKLKNPIYHHTNLISGMDILKSRKIKPTSSFKGIEHEVAGETAYDWDKAFSITRDPMFSARPHSNIGTDVRFIMDRDDLIKKGYKIKPIAVEGFKKTVIDPNRLPIELKKKNYQIFNNMNPRFEFEERILGNMPTKDIKLIDIANLKRHPNYKKTDYDDAKRQFSILKDILQSSDIPIIMSNLSKKYLKSTNPTLSYFSKAERKRLNKAPTYKYNPFKLNKSK